VQFLGLQKVSDLDLDLGSGRSHWCTYPVKVYPQLMRSKSEKLCGPMYGWTDGQTSVPVYYVIAGR